jgi:hypothetical protein
MGESVKCSKNKLPSPPVEIILSLETVLNQDDLYTQEFISNRDVLNRQAIKIFAKFKNDILSQLQGVIRHDG